jgi:GNAT superfamily N-acetyltransferase
MQIVEIGHTNREKFQKLFDEGQWEAGEGIFVLGAVWEDTACGVIICRQEMLRVEVLWLYVDPLFRRNGIATGLLKEVEDKTKGTMVACIYEAEDGVKAFFKSQGFFMSESSVLYKFSFADARKKRMLHKYLFRFFRYKVKRLGELTEDEQDQLPEFWNGFDITAAEFETGEYSSSLSSCVLDTKHKICACMLCTETEGNVFIHSMVAQAGSPTVYLLLFRHLYEELEIHRSHNTVIHFLATNPNVIKLARKLLDDCVSEESRNLYVVKLNDY